ncbi:MAG: bifunctional (p)ppGpp synthetase/guanosine-3',5'-bis(diphosphate) 3'-pyrophosphohydrolase [Clostridia bacterium]|nr:bifunctional (p)ppGpp synthetase/guanosine-3',5'-bis(diphosphate) 3'-pyrophosphohydrolase [Clostridia bacterium]
MQSGIDKLMTVLKRTEKNYDFDKIKKAYYFAEKCHDGQFRFSGEPYITHPLAVAQIAAGLSLDTDSICAALLHDTVEDCDVTLDVIKSNFGDDIASLVDGLTKLVQIDVEDKEEAHIENLRKMLLAMAKDIRVIFIKLCDRLHNMRTLNVKNDEKRRSTALETMYVYAPLAHRLGIQRIKQELENLALLYLDPIGYHEVEKHIASKYSESQDFINKAKKEISEKLTENGIKFAVAGRVKSIYSIYRKMYNQNKTFDEIYDFYAMRIIVDTELECYTVLGIIHEMFNSMPGRFKDYISTPKPNLYRSLHTTVIGRDGIPFEVQIRTWEMHEVAQYGVAAHWKYKSGEGSGKDIDEKLAWIANLIENESETRDPDEFMGAFKIDIFQDETFVFSPKGDVFALPSGSNAIDFAYAVHTQVGNQMVGAKVNGNIVPIDKVLQTGDIVEVITSNASKGPSRDWLKIAATSTAKNKIRQWFKKEARPENINVGRDEVERELNKYNRPYTEEQKDEIVLAVAQRIGIQDIDDLYNTIGYGGITITKLSAKLRDEFDRTVKVEEQNVPMTAEDVKITKQKRSTNGGVVIDGVDGCQVKFAHCCSPVPGDQVIGFITKGFGISVHKADCPNIINAMKNPENRDRFVSAYWDNEELHSPSGAFEASIKIHAGNSLSLIADITFALADMRVQLLQINSNSKADDLVIVNLTVNCRNTEHLNSIIARLRQIKSVERVSRG